MIIIIESTKGDQFYDVNHAKKFDLMISIVNWIGKNHIFIFG